MRIEFRPTPGKVWEIERSHHGWIATERDTRVSVHGPSIGMTVRMVCALNLTTWEEESARRTLPRREWDDKTPGRVEDAIFWVSEIDPDDGLEHAAYTVLFENEWLTFDEDDQPNVHHNPFATRELDDVFLSALALARGDNRRRHNAWWAWFNEYERTAEGRELAHSLGYKMNHTGGGCTSWERETDDDSYAMVTNDADAHGDPEEREWAVSRQFSDDSDGRWTSTLGRDYNLLEALLLGPYLPRPSHDDGQELALGPEEADELLAKAMAHHAAGVWPAP
jgi:hypothetical protein